MKPTFLVMSSFRQESLLLESVSLVGELLPLLGELLPLLEELLPLAGELLPLEGEPRPLSLLSLDSFDSSPDDPMDMESGDAPRLSETTPKLVVG